MPFCHIVTVPLQQQESTRNEARPFNVQCGRQQVRMCAAAGVQTAGESHSPLAF